VAWSGAAPIARVEVSVGEGDWQEARLEGESQRGSWRKCELITRLDQAGASDMRARATDQAGNTQPERAEWNNLGHGNNSIQQEGAAKRTPERFGSEPDRVATATKPLLGRN
jgi:hypothetical protein